MVAPWHLSFLQPHGRFLFLGGGGMLCCSQRRVGSLDWSTKLSGGGWEEPGQGGRAVQVSLCSTPSWCRQHWAQPCLWDPFQLTCTPSCLVPAVVASH